jgi:hypothetical protein
MAQAQLIAEMAQSGTKKGIGIWQMLQAKKMKDEMGEQPLYQTPDSLTQGYDTAEAELKKGFGGALSSAQNRAVEGLPYAIRKNFQERMGQQTASALEFSGKRARGLAGLRDILSANQQGSNTLLDAEAAAKLSAQKDVEGLTVDQGIAMSGLAQDKGTALGPEQEKAYFLNQYNPFMQNKGEMQAMQGASMQNFTGGSSQGADAMANYGISQEEKQAASA